VPVPARQRHSGGRKGADERTDGRGREVVDNKEFPRELQQVLITGRLIKPEVMQTFNFSHFRHFGDTMKVITKRGTKIVEKS